MDYSVLIGTSILLLKAVLLRAGASAGSVPNRALSQESGRQAWPMGITRLKNSDRLDDGSLPSSPPAPPAAAQPALNRPGRARLRTRQKLIDAAHRIIARKGVDATTINDITEEADVGLGSFYNHFASKDKLVGVVFETRIEELGKVFDRISLTVTDPAQVVAFVQKIFLEKVRVDNGWGWFAIHAEIDPHFF